MWNVYEDKFVHNDVQVEVVLSIWGLIDYDYLSPIAKKLYRNLNQDEYKHILERKK